MYEWSSSPRPIDDRATRYWGVSCVAMRCSRSSSLLRRCDRQLGQGAKLDDPRGGGEEVCRRPPGICRTSRVAARARPDLLGRSGSSGATRPSGGAGPDARTSRASGAGVPGSSAAAAWATSGRRPVSRSRSRWACPRHRPPSGSATEYPVISPGCAAEPLHSSCPQSYRRRFAAEDTPLRLIHSMEVTASFPP
jgi:hypothetical protein